MLLIHLDLISLDELEVFNLDLAKYQLQKLTGTTKVLSIFGEWIVSCMDRVNVHDTFREGDEKSWLPYNIHLLFIFYY